MTSCHPLFSSSLPGSARKHPLIEAERALLDFGISWFDTWSGKEIGEKSCCYETADVAISDDGATIHEVRYFKGHSPEAAMEAEGGCPPVVLMHGWAAGASIFATSVPAIRASWPGPVIALDWFGCGLSSRPRWRFGVPVKDVTAAEQFFVDALEKWRAARGFERIVLVGHSMGGFLGGCYASAYPQHIERLVLASSAGLFSHGEPGCWGKIIMAVIVRSLLRIARTLRGGRYIASKYFGLFKPASWLPFELQVEYHSQSWNSRAGEASGLYANTLLGTERTELSDRLASLHTCSGFNDSARVVLIQGGDHDPSKELSLLFIQRLSKLGIKAKQLEVVDGGHTMQTANPIGFAEAVLAACGNWQGSRSIFGEDALQREATESQRQDSRRID